MADVSNETSVIIAIQYNVKNNSGRHDLLCKLGSVTGTTLSLFIKNSVLQRLSQKTGSLTEFYTLELISKPSSDTIQYQ